MDYKMLFLFFSGLYCYGVWKENFDIPDKIMTDYFAPVFAA